MALHHRTAVVCVTIHRESQLTSAFTVFLSQLGHNVTCSCNKSQQLNANSNTAHHNTAQNTSPNTLLTKHFFSELMPNVMAALPDICDAHY